MFEPRPRRAIRPSPAVRVARIAVPTPLATGLGICAAGTVIWGDDAQVAYPSPASTDSVDSTPTMMQRRSPTANHMDHVARLGLRQQWHRLADDFETTPAQQTDEGWT
jgi:hypothetical protein